MYSALPIPNTFSLKCKLKNKFVEASWKKKNSSDICRRYKYNAVSIQYNIQVHVMWINLRLNTNIFHFDRKIVCFCGKKLYILVEK